MNADELDSLTERVLGPSLRSPTPWVPDFSGAAEGVGSPLRRNITLSKTRKRSPWRASAHHFADLRRQFGGRERLLQIVDFAVHQSVPENHLVGIAGHEEHLDLRPEIGR